MRVFAERMYGIIKYVKTGNIAKTLIAIGGWEAQPVDFAVEQKLKEI